MNDAIKLIETGQRVLVLTYTINNQQELQQRFVRNNRGSHPAYSVKGLFTFYLEEIIRPYQRALFPKRIEGFVFNTSDPHKRNGYTIPGRSEIVNGKINPLYYLTDNDTAAHSTLLAKLAYTIIKATDGAPIRRLEAIYNQLYFDECQDLVGWDYEVLALLSKSKQLKTTCVGDFRQTIYDTAVTNKKPGTNVEKLQFLKKLKFDEEQMNISHRCVQSICDYAGTLHAADGFPNLKSRATVPAEHAHHIGVFQVKETDASRYLEMFRPVLLRLSISSGLEYNDIPLKRLTFGTSKGLGFPRTAIIPTTPHLNYLQGQADALNKGKTEVAKNKFYVALTRARYSVALIVPDRLVAKCSLPIWSPV